MIQRVGCLLCTCVWQPRAFLYVSRLGCVVWIGVLVFLFDAQIYTDNLLLPTAIVSIQLTLLQYK